MTTIIILYAILGIIAGLLAGLLGIGGGIIIVPMLTYSFELLHFPQQYIMHLALGTSMACILFTSISSAYSHHRHKNVLWKIVLSIAPSILLGTFLGSFIASRIPTKFLQIFFSLFLFFVSIQLITGKTPKPNRQLPTIKGMSIIGGFIGIISSLVGIGGGTLSVPFMIFHNVEIRKAIGTSAAIGISIAFAGTCGYFVNGIQVPKLPDFSLGYIYLPALLGITLFSTFTSPLGAKLTQKLPTQKIKKYFSILLLIIGIKMLLETI